MERFVAIIADGMSCKMEPNWTFLGVVWYLGTIFGCSAGLWKYLGSVLGRLSKSCGLEASSGVNFHKIQHAQNDAQSES